MSYQSSAYEPVGVPASGEGATAPVMASSSSWTPSASSGASFKPETLAGGFLRNALYVLSLISFMSVLISLMTPFLGVDAEFGSSAPVPTYYQNKVMYGGFGPFYWQSCAMDPAIDDVVTCTWRGESDSGTASPAAKAFGVAGPGAAFFLIIQLISVFVVIELINPELRVTIGRFIVDQEKRLRLAVTLQLVQAALSLVALLWFFIAMGAGGFDSNQFLKTAILYDDTGSTAWLKNPNFLTLGAGGVITLLNILLLPVAWWFLRKRLQ